MFLVTAESASGLVAEAILKRLRSKHTHSYTHTHTEIILSHKQRYSATTQMYSEDIMLSEISCTEKDKYKIFSYMWNLKNQNKRTNKTKYRKTHIEQIGGYRGEGG